MNKKDKTLLNNTIVLGMHRSGTSALAGSLERLGWWLANDGQLMRAKDDNPSGFWERQDVADLNDDILKSQGTSWHAALYEEPSIKAVSSEFKVRIESIVQELLANAPFLIKDPRLCLTWREWAKHLEDTKLLVIVRHPMEVAHSLKSRNDIPIELGLGLWHRYIKSIANIINDKEVFCVEHSEFIENPRDVLAQVLKFLGAQNLADEQEKEGLDTSVVNPDLVHHKGSDEDLTNYYPKLLTIWDQVKLGNFSDISDFHEFYENDQTRETYNLWVLSEDRKGEIQSLTSEYNARYESLNAEIKSHQQQLFDLKRSIDLQQGHIADSLLSYQSSKGYRISRLVSSSFRLGRNSNKADAIDNIAEILEDQGQIKKIDSSSQNTSKNLISLALSSPIKFIRLLTLSRIKTGLRALHNKDARANLSTALAKYQSAASQLKLELITPGSILVDDIYFPYCDMPKVSIIVPVFNEIDSTLATLKSIQESVTNIEYEVIVADDCSDDATTLLNGQIDNITVVSPKENQGFLGNCNHAAKFARGEYIAFLNNDVNVQTDWLEYLITPMEKDQRIGLVGSKLVYPDGRLQEAGGIIFSDASGWNYGRLGDPSAPEFNYTREVDYVSGASFALKRDLWETLGGFDEIFKPAYYEDTDLCFQVRQSGYKVIYSPRSVVVHYEGVSHGTDESTGVKQYQTVNKGIFLKKWKTVLDKQHYCDSKQLFLAKVHGKDNKTILIIDHYVPMHDKDAGSRSTRKYINLLVEEGFRVIFLGDNFYPHQPYTQELQHLGVEVLHGDYFKRNWEDWLRQNLKHINCVYIFRPHVAKTYLSKIKLISPKTRVVFFGSDLHYLRVQREAQLTNNPNLVQDASEWKKLELEIMRQVDLSLYPAEYEVKEIKAQDGNIAVDHIPLFWFKEQEIFASRMLPQRQNLLFVGGFGHPPNLDGLNWFIDYIWPTIMQLNQLVTLTIIGSKCPESVKKLNNDRIRVLGEVNDLTLEQAYSKASIAIVPLRYGAGIKGKVLEAMSKGVPVCTTSVGAEGLPELENGYLITEDDANLFASEVLDLLENPQRLQKLQLSAINILRDHFSRNKALSLVKFLTDDLQDRNTDADGS